MSGQHHAVIFFDGVCNLCNGFVRFIVKHDRKGYFRFSSLQSDAAATLLEPYLEKPNLAAGVILLENGKLYHKSTAGLRILKALNGPFRLLYAFIVVPAFIRNFVYDLIASNRYRWFGKKKECMVPDDETAKRFIP